MTATTLYVEACKRLLFLDSQNTENPSSWDDHFSLLPKLRQALSCRVCRGLLVDPHGSQSCQHFVCRGCLRKKKSLNPGCRWCLNLDKLKEDKQIRIVMACYKKLCEVLMASPEIKPHLHVQNGEINHTQAILLEAISTPISLDEQGQPIIEAHGIDASRSGENLNPVEIQVQKKAPDEVVIAKRQVLQILKETGDEDNSPKGRKRKKHFRGSSYFSPKRRKVSNRTKSEEAEILEDILKNDTMGNAETSTGDTVTEDDVFCNGNDEIKNEIEENEEDDENEKFHDCLSVSTANNVEIKCEELTSLTVNAGGKEEVIVKIDESTSETELTNSVETFHSSKNKIRNKQKSCFCGRRVTSLKSGNKSCANVRCPCYLGGYSCEDCPCKFCTNPYNEKDNNNLSKNLSSCGSTEVTFVHDEEIILVS